MKMKNNIFKSGMTLVVSLLFFGSASYSQKLQIGIWHARLLLNDSTDLPFIFEVNIKEDGVFAVIFHNAKERIETKECLIKKDSIFIKMPVFDSEFKAKLFSSDKKSQWSQNDIMEGEWINHARKNKNIIRFSARQDQEVLRPAKLKTLTNGRWEATFSPDTKDFSKAVGIFSNDSTSIITGTFLTETGDYRFLNGHFNYDSSFHLSCFDGSHAFLFKGKVKGDSIINGHFYSGAHHHEPWVAKRNDKFELRDPDSLTYLKPGYTGIDFSFKNAEGKTVSLKDDKFKNKVVIVQLMGTWCPNCMDETKFLAPFYDKYKSKGLEVVALAFERTDSFGKAASNIERSKSRFNANYEFLITMKTGKDQASEALPMLNAVMAFPTTIYIDKKGKVRKIYTGFNGPATGNAYTKFAEDTERFVEKLLAE
jgi:thiol-disulfide isomerase/thioredoxin